MKVFLLSSPRLGASSASSCMGGRKGKSITKCWDLKYLLFKVNEEAK